MAEGELAGLSREALLELVRRQQAELAEHEAAIERRDEKIRAIEEEELLPCRRPAKTPESSSVPPSGGPKANRLAGRRRKRGPKRGRVGVSRVRSEPDIVIACRPSACAGCSAGLPQTGGRRTGRSHNPSWSPSATRDPHGVTELPAVTPVVLEGWQYAVTCAHCGVETRGAYPTGLEPWRTFGPGIEALLSYLHERHYVGYERLVEVCRDMFGLAISRVAWRTRCAAWSEGPVRPTRRSGSSSGAARSSTRTRPARRWPGAITGSGCSRRPRPATTSSSPAVAAR